LKQQSVDRYVASLRHIILILSQYLFLFPNDACLSGEAVNTNFIVFGLTQSRMDSRSKHANHYNTVAIILGLIYNKGLVNHFQESSLQNKDLVFNKLAKRAIYDWSMVKLNQ
jgi:hypothetical protein